MFRGLTIGSGDKRVLDALELMNSEGVSSLAVVDSQLNVVGNISVADVKVDNPIWRVEHS
jgi:CBS domain-containing protein